MKRFFRSQMFAFLATVLPMWLIFLNALFRVVSPDIASICAILTMAILGGIGLSRAMEDEEVLEIIDAKDRLVIATVVYSAGGAIATLLLVGFSKTDDLLIIVGGTAMIACAYVYATWATKRAYEQKNA